MHFITRFKSGIQKPKKFKCHLLCSACELQQVLLATNKDRIVTILALMFRDFAESRELTHEATGIKSYSQLLAVWYCKLIRTVHSIDERNDNGKQAAVWSAGMFVKRTYFK